MRLLKVILIRALIVLFIVGVPVVIINIDPDLFGSYPVLIPYVIIALIGVLAFLMVGIEPSTSTLKTQGLSTKTPIDPEFLKQVLQFFASSAKPVTFLLADNKKPGVYDSKIGGDPYLPPGFEYPTDLRPDYKNEPLILLCQLNFAQLPPLEGYPQDGILQFYISGNAEDTGYEDPFGLNFDEPTTQDGWRVVYHPVPLADMQQVSKPPVVKNDFAGVLYKKEYALKAKSAQMAVNVQDYRYEEYYDLFASTQRIEGKYDQADEVVLNDNVFRSLEQAKEKSLGLDGKYDPDSIFTTEGHWIGGYNYDAQEDPRQFEEHEDYSCLLLHLGTSYENEDEPWLDSFGDISIADEGTINFYIKPRDLARRNFNKVLFNWDSQ